MKDEYITSLLKSHVKCFGKYSFQAEVCQGCILKKECMPVSFPWRSSIVVNYERKKPPPKNQGSLKDAITAIKKAVSGWQQIRHPAGQPPSPCAICEEMVGEGLCYWNPKTHALVHERCLQRVDA